MWGSSVKLFTLFGFTVKVDASWAVIATLVLWSLAVWLFPTLYPGLDASTYWVMGAVGAIGLFASIVLHEMCHALVARRHNLQISGITLFIFGGVAEMEDEPTTPGAEFQVAVAGPLCSIGVALLSMILLFTGQQVFWPAPVLAIFHYLAWINFVLVLFNLVPAFPLDGGRVLRSALWKYFNDITRATRISSWIGAGFGMVLIALGFLEILGGSLIAGLWWILIGFFIRQAANASFQQLLIRNVLEGVPVEQFLRTDMAAVPADSSLTEVVNNYIYRQHERVLPVVRDGHLVGRISTRQIRDIPPAQWPEHTAGELAEPIPQRSLISRSADAMRALSQLSRQNSSRLMVTEGDQLLGSVALQDLQRFVAVRRELEQNIDQED